MSILVDLCVPRKYVLLLKSWGYEASFLTEHAAADSEDANVIKLAQAQDAVLLTVDLDFANIMNYPPNQYAGIIVMRYEAKNEAMLTATLRQALTDLYRDGLRGTLVIVTPKSYRTRRS